MKYLLLIACIVIAGCSQPPALTGKAELPDPAVISAEIRDPMAPDQYNDPSTPPLSVSGGDGSSFDQAIVIVGARGRLILLKTQADAISKLFGPQEEAWKITSKQPERQNKTCYELLHISLTKDGSVHTIYFDVTDYMENL